MLIILQMLLMLTAGRCSDGPIFEAKTVAVGQDVKLTCSRDNTVARKLFWMRLVSGNFPEILAGKITLDFDEDIRYDDHIIAKQEPGMFVLHIRNTRLSDTAVYYCVQVENKMTFLRGTFLRIKGPDSDVTAITRVSPSDPVLANVVNFQCSVLSAANNTTCGEERKLYWFKTGPGSPLSPVFANEGSTGKCSQSGGGPSQQECVYSFHKSIASSDAGDYLCAVATCGLIVLGKPQKLNIEVSKASMWPFSDLQTANVTILVMFHVMAVTLVVTAVLVWALKTKSCDCCIAAVTVPSSLCNTKKQRIGDSCINTSVFFTMMKGEGGQDRDAEERRRIHYAIKDFGFE